MCLCVLGGGAQTFELAIPLNSFTNINTPVSMEEAAEPEQGVLGITKLIWGQTEDTCALKERQGLRTHAALMRGGQLGLDSACLGGRPTPFAPYLGSYRSLPPLWMWRILWQNMSEVQGSSASLQVKREVAGMQCSCAVCHVWAHRGRCFTPLREARGTNLVLTV